MRRIAAKPRTNFRLVATAVISICSWTAAPPAMAQVNDDCAQATPVTALPFSDTIDTTTATSDPSDLTATCLYSTDHSVWYSFTASRDVALEIRTAGSDYDTVVAAFDATCGAVVEELGCNDDDLTSFQSELLVLVPGGASVLIEVVGSAGGNLQIDIVESASALASPKNLQEVATSDDASPLGGVMAALGDPMVLSGKEVAYSSTQTVLVASSGGVTSTILARGDPSPVGGVFGRIDPPDSNAVGESVFRADLVGVGPDSGIFLWDGATVTPIAVEGDLAPDGGTYRTFDHGVAINDGGDVAFVAKTTVDDSLFLLSGGSGHVLASEGDATSCGGNVFSFYADGDELDLSNSGAVVVTVRASGIGAHSGIYLIDTGGVQTVACEGDASPAGGTFTSLAYGSTVNSAGVVLFEARTSSPTRDALYSWSSGGGVALQLLEGDVIASGQTVDGLDRRVGLEINDAFVAAFGTSGLVARTPAGWPLSAAVAVAAVGDACPTGGTITGAKRDRSVSLGPTGDVAFDAECEAGTGAYLAPGGGGALQQILATPDALAIGAGFSPQDVNAAAAGDAMVSATRLAVIGSRCTASSCSVAGSIAAPTDPAPGLPGDVIDTISRDSIAGKGKVVAYVATSTGTARSKSIVRWRKGASSLVALEGVATPDGLGTIGDLDTGMRLGVGKRGVAFMAGLSHPSGFQGLFFARKNVTTQIALEGDVTPAGGTYEEFEAVALGRRDVAFLATDSLLGECVFSARRSGDVSRIVCEGDPGPAEVGGVVGNFGTPSPGRRGVYFETGISGGTSDRCLLFGDGTTIDVVACADDLLPGGGYVSFDDSGVLAQVDAAVAGRGIAYLAYDKRTLTGFSVLAHRNGATTVLAREYAPIPTPVGGVYHSLTAYAPALDKKMAAFVGTVDGGSADRVLMRGTIR